MKTKNIAFTAIRMQPFHKGHFRLIAEMLSENELVIIGLGSVQIEKTSANPFTPKERTEFLKKVFGDTKKIKIVPLRDIGAVDKEAWSYNCMKRIKGSGIETPNRYYGGSATDIEWFKGMKNLNCETLEIINMERYSTNIMSGTEIRKALSNNSEEWKNHVPECIHELVEDNYPKELTLKYNINLKKQKDNV